MGRLRLLLALTALGACRAERRDPPVSFDERPAAPRYTRQAGPRASQRLTESLPPRFESAAATLHDGRILVIGGGDAGLSAARSDASVYDPASGRWSRAAPARRPRYSFTATTLKDGRVLIAGGRDGSGSFVLEAEIYDPRANSWSSAGMMRGRRSTHAAALLRDGRVLVAGGYEGFDRNAATCEIFEPRENAWSDCAPMRSPRAAFVLVSLRDGRVLAAGGSQDGSTTLSQAEFFSPMTGRWTPAPPLSTPRYAPAFLLSRDGRVVVIGGSNRGAPLASSEVFDPAADAWSPLGNMRRARALFGAVLREDKVLVIGGRDRDADIESCELLDLRTRTWSQGPRLRLPTAHALAVAVPNGALIVSGRAGGAPLTEPEFVSFTNALSRAAPPLPATPKRAPTRPDDLAVVVGVERYKSLPPADYAENDASRFAAALAALGVPEENVVVLTGERASMTGLAKYAEEWLAKRATGRSRVWFFYSGHGAPEIKDGTPFLMPWDADAAFVRSTGFPLKRLYSALDALPAREIIAVFDACFTGSGERSVLAPGLRPLVPVAAPSAPARVTVLAAASQEETAGSLPEARHGLFTHFLLEGLSGAADADGDGHATVEEVHAYARKRVIIEARKLDREQTPTLSAPDPKLRIW